MASLPSFAANMAMRQKALDHQKEYSQVIKAVLEPFYVDEGLTGAESVEEALKLHESFGNSSTLEDLHFKRGS